MEAVQVREDIWWHSGRNVEKQSYSNISGGKTHSWLVESIKDERKLFGMILRFLTL